MRSTRISVLKQVQERLEMENKDNCMGKALVMVKGMIADSEVVENAFAALDGIEVLEEISEHLREQDPATH